ncbi:MAG: beta-L-arabinofuranosidase domain-containing protein [Eubacteriales bacterium]
MNDYPSLSSVAIDGENAFSVNFAGDLRYLAELDCDRMLYNFRTAFGETPACEPIYGWDAPDGLLRGHSTGHFLSALALAYCASGNTLYKSKLDYMVSELRRLQQKSHGVPHEFVTACTPDDCAQEKWSRNPDTWGEGYLSAYPPDQFALLEQFTPYAKIWAPYYTLHKLLAGLIEAYERTGNRTALNTAAGIGAWVCDRLAPLSAEHRVRMWKMYIAGEYGGMNESLARLALLTGDRTFLAGAAMFDNANIFPGLARGEDTIQNLHANQHIPQILGALLEYRATGNVEYLRTAQNFFSIVTQNHMYATGGVGQGECFREPNRQAHFIKSDTNCETCATYNLIKVARELYSHAPDDAGCMDYIERALFNHILASRHPEIGKGRTNGVTYMLPIGPGAEKQYTDDYHSFTCCHGTGMENHVKYGDCIYFLAESAVYINQYIPSTLREDGIFVKIGLSFPGLRGSITVSADRDVTVKLRVPSWCANNPFTAEGKAVDVCGRYAVLSCKSGETVNIDVQFSFGVRLEILPDLLSDYDLHTVNRNTHYHEDKQPDDAENSLDKTPRWKTAALLCGPFVMVTCDRAKEYLRLPPDAAYTVSMESGRLAVTGAGRVFRPIYEVHDEPYHTYFVIA